MELHREDSKSRRRRKSVSIEETSLEAIDRLLSSADIDVEEIQISIEEEKRERNKRVFPDTQTIDPYDPTTYGYIELGKYVCVIFSCA
jgi:DNA-binding MarR family transcriptional regulator